MLINTLLNDTEVILASASPRRQELLHGMDIPYTQGESYEVSEIYPTDTPPHEVPLYLSQLKSNAYPQPLERNQVLITADTVVILEDRVIGKPLSRDEILIILRDLSGNMHEVVTGVTLRNDVLTHNFSATSRVWFRELEEDELQYYADTYMPYDKAGAYGIQEWIGYVGIERIEGSFYNVMGLPTRQLYTHLIDFMTETQNTQP